MTNVGSPGEAAPRSGEGRREPERPEISIVIPCYNASAVLAPCLESIYARPPARRFEVVVVNDASTDGTVAMVRRTFPQVRILDNPHNLGYSRATNRGVAEAKGRFVHLLNSDVEFPDGSTLDLLADHLEAHPEVGAAGTLLYNRDGSIQASVKALPSFISALFGARSFVSVLWPDNRFTRRELLHWRAAAGVPFPAGYISSASLMLSRDLFRAVGSLDSDFFHFADADLCKRITDSGRSVVCIPHAKAIHDAHQGGTGGSVRRRLRLVTSFHRGAYRYYRKHSGTSVWHPSHAVVAAALGLRCIFAVLVHTVEELLLPLRRQRSTEEPIETVEPTDTPAPAAAAAHDVDVTLVIASYNSGAMLEACLESLYANPSRRTLEVYVVDDASADGSAEMVRSRFPDVRLLVNLKNIGYGRSCNLAIAKARGRYVYLVNNDVVMLPGVTDELVDFLDAHPEAGAAGSLLYNSDGTIQRSVKAHPSFRSALFGARSYFSTWFPGNPFSRAELLHWKGANGTPFAAGYVSGASLMVRHEEFARIGALDPIFTYFNDADFCRRLWKSGRQVFYVPQARAIHHDHQGGTRVNPRRRFLSVIEFHVGAFRYYRRHSGTPAWHPLNAVVVLGLAWRFLPCIVVQTIGELVRTPRTVSGSETGDVKLRSQPDRTIGGGRSSVRRET